MITVPEMEPGELLPVPEPLPEVDPPPAPSLPPLPDPVVEPDADPVPEPVPPEELPDVDEPLDAPLPPEPVCDGGVVGVDGLFAAVVEEPVLPQPVSSSAEARTAALRRPNEI